MYNNILEPLQEINDITYGIYSELKGAIKSPSDTGWLGGTEDEIFELKDKLGQTDDSIQCRIKLLYNKDVENFNNSERNLLDFEIADKIDNTQSLLDLIFDSIKTLQDDTNSNTKNVIEKGSLYYIEISQILSLITQTVTKSTQGAVEVNSKNIKLSEQTIISKPIKVALNPENQKTSIMHFDIQNFRIVRYISSICEFLGELYTKKTSGHSIPSNFQSDAIEIIYSEFRTIDTEGLKNRLALYFSQDTQSLTLSEYELYCNKVKEDIEYCDLILYQFSNEFEEDNRLDESFSQIRNTINSEIRKKNFYFYQTGQKIHPSSNLFELIKEMEVWIIRILFFMKNLAIDGEKVESIINSNSSNTISKKLKKIFRKIEEITSKYEDEDESNPAHSISRIIETLGYIDDKPKHLDEVTSSLGVFFMSLNHGTDAASIPTELALRMLFEKSTKEMNLEEIRFYKQNLLNEYRRVDSKYKELLSECKKWSEYINTEDDKIFFMWGVNRIGKWPEFETALEEKFNPLLKVIGADEVSHTHEAITPIDRYRENNIENLFAKSEIGSIFQSLSDIYEHIETIYSNIATSINNFNPDLFQGNFLDYLKKESAQKDHILGYYSFENLDLFYDADTGNFIDISTENVITDYTNSEITLLNYLPLKRCSEIVESLQRSIFLYLAELEDINPNRSNYQIVKYVTDNILAYASLFEDILNYTREIKNVYKEEPGLNAFPLFEDLTNDIYQQIPQLLNKLKDDVYSKYGYNTMITSFINTTPNNSEISKYNEDEERIIKVGNKNKKGDLAHLVNVIDLIFKNISSSYSKEEIAKLAYYAIYGEIPQNRDHAYLHKKITGTNNNDPANSDSAESETEKKVKEFLRNLNIELKTKK